MDCKRKADLTEFMKVQIYALRIHAKWKLNDIADELDVKYETIKKYLHRVSVDGQGDGSHRDQCGRKPCTTADNDMQIVEMSEQNPFLSCNTIKSRLNLTCSRQTVSRRLLEAGLHSRKPAMKTELTENHKERRLVWAIEKMLWSRRRWEAVCFTDESKFCLGQSFIQYVRRPVGERYNENYLLLSPNHSVGNVMIWGGFSVHSFTNLVRIDGILNADRYITILNDNFIPAVNTILPGNDKLFQHDNAPIHTARRTKTFLAENNVNILDWPPYSPDMNPIEHVWARMESILCHCYQRPENSDQLYETLNVIWVQLMSDVEYRKTLIHSMMHRVQCLFNANGSYTHY